MLSFIPFTAFILIAYNAVVFTQGVSVLSETLINIPLPTIAISGAEISSEARIWNIVYGDILIIVGLIALYIEIFKATRTNSTSVIDHTLSMLVFIAFLVEFLLYRGAGNSVFFILMFIALIDVIAGFTVSIIGARRDLGIE